MMYTVKELSEILKVSEKAVRNRLLSNKIKAKKFDVKKAGKPALYTEEQLEKIKTAKVGRPKLKKEV